MKETPINSFSDLSKILFAITLIPLAICCTPKSSYTELRNSFKTNLIVKKPSFQIEPALNKYIDSFQKKRYQSDSLTLQILLDTTHIHLSNKPILVYLHGGFAIQTRELEELKLFRDAGFIIAIPTFRGENGNPGYFECFMGEVDDAKAAITWVQSQDFAANSPTYVFGWSVGGGIAMNLALLDDIRIDALASSAGVYDLDLIRSWATEDDYIQFPYDYNDSLENYFRLPLYHANQFVRKHISYIGVDDDYEYISQLKQHLHPDGVNNWELVQIEGDHVSSLNKAMQLFIREIQSRE